MSLEKHIITQIEILAQPEMVWDALINPNQTQKYMYGCKTVSDWKIGSSLLWEGEYQEQKMVFVKGYIVRYQANEVLEYTVFDPNNKTMEDIPENYLNVIYKLEKTNNGTLLTVTQGDYTTVADGGKRYQDAYNNGDGWGPILREIKKLLEN